VLEFLDLSRCSNIKDRSLEALCKNCAESLRVIDISYCQHLTDNGVRALSMCLSLEDLSLEGNMGITYESLDQVVTSCPLLNSLNLSGKKKNLNFVSYPF